MRLRTAAAVLAFLPIQVLLSAASTIPAAAAPDDAAVIITNRNYADGTPLSRFAHGDGDAFTKAAVEVLGLDRARIRLHQDVTAAAMRRILAPDGSVAGLLRGRPKARLVVYYAGHGTVAASRPTLLPIDVAPALAGSDGYPLRTLIEDASALVGADGELLVIVEAGFAGVEGQGWAAGLGRRGVAVMLAAGGGAALVDEPAANSAAKGRELGLFTDALIEGLHGAAADGGRRISVGELHRHTTRLIADRIGVLFPGRSWVQIPELITADLGWVIATLPAGPIARGPASVGAPPVAAVLPAPKFGSENAPPPKAGGEKAPAPKVAAAPTDPGRPPASTTGIDATARQAAPDPAQKDASTVAPADPDRADLVKSIHKELRRVGCEPGSSAVWGKSLTRALEAFQRSAKSRLDTASPSPAILAALQARRGRVCPLTCDDDEVVVGGECRPRPAPSKSAAPKAIEKKSPVHTSTEPKRPVPKAKAADDDAPPAKRKSGTSGGGGGSTSSAGDCPSFMFNGQVCTDGRGRTCVQRFHQRICTY